MDQDVHSLTVVVRIILKDSFNPGLPGIAIGDNPAEDLGTVPNGGKAEEQGRAFRNEERNFRTAHYTCCPTPTLLRPVP